MFARMNEMWLEVFATGEHTDAGGNTHTWSLEDLYTIAALYNGQQAHEAPAVLGHPRDDSPAYGWVKELAVIGDKLWAHFVDLEDGFVHLLQDKRFKKRSIALNEDLLLRHIGFLGAVPPAVKGLKDPTFHAHNRIVFAGAFSAYEIPSINFKFSEFSMDEQQIQMLLSFILESLGQETANQVSTYLTENGITAAMTPEQLSAFTVWLQETFGDEAATTVAAKIAELQAAPTDQPAPDGTTASDTPDTAAAQQPAQPTNPTPVPAQPAAGAHASKKKSGKQLLQDAQFKEKQQMQQRINDLEKKDRRNDFADRCRQLEELGIVTPAQRPVVLDFAESLYGKEFNFAESKQGKKPAVEQFFALLNTFKPQVELNNEFANKGSQSKSSSKSRSRFSGSVDDDRMKEYEAIEAYQEKHKIKSFAEAKRRYEREQKEGGK